VTSRPTAPTRRHFALLAIAFAAFALYGSWVPLQYRPLAWEVAQRRWSEVCSIPIRVESKSDWAANILLFTPIGFFGMAALCADRRRAADLWAVPLIAACIGFSVFLEFSQLYFPPRTSSLDDVTAESVGAALGVLVWMTAGRPLTRQARALWAGSETSGTAGRLVIAYLVVLAVVQIMPPDLTISPHELYHKYKAGLVRPVPFTAWPADPATGVKKLLEGAAWFLPLGLLLARVPRWRRGQQAAWEVLLVGIAVAGAVEFERLVVVVHSSDATDVITNPLVVLAGWYVGGEGRDKSVRGFAVATWVAALAYLNWHPFDLQRGADAWERWQNLSWLPFADYLQTAYLSSLENAADKVIQFAALGALTAAALAPTRVRAWHVIVPAALLAAVFEAGQLFLPTRYTSVTDVLVEAGSAGLGFAICSRLRRRNVNLQIWAAAA